MRIVVMSDTHIPLRGAELPAMLTRALADADMAIHAGDFTDAGTLERLRLLPRFVGVAGNMDLPAVRRALREREILDVEGVRLAVVHGAGAPEPLPRFLRAELAGERPDVIVFGHTHRALNERIDGVLMFNPGSPTDTVFAPYRSFGVLTIEAGRVSGEIVRLPPDHTEGTAQ